jgi:hypothetical protein
MIEEVIDIITNTLRCYESGHITYTVAEQRILQVVRKLEGQ